jgi:acetyltransferase
LQPGPADEAWLVRAGSANHAGTDPALPLQLARILTAGIPWAPVQSEDEAVATAQRFGFPVAAKTGDPLILHKSDIGGVFLNLQDATAVRQAYRKLAAVGGPAVLVEKMAEPGLEWFIGGRQDNQFGAVVITGLGGIAWSFPNGHRVLPSMTKRPAACWMNAGGRVAQRCAGDGMGSRGADQCWSISWLLHDFPDP